MRRPFASVAARLSLCSFAPREAPVEFGQQHGLDWRSRT